MEVFLYFFEFKQFGCQLWASLILAKEKVDLSRKIESLKKEMGEEITCKKDEFSKMVDSLKNDAT